jgi:hypothetical protein
MMVIAAVAITARGQVGSSPMQLLHPILKDPNKRNAPTSLNQDPSMPQDLNQGQGQDKGANRLAAHLSSAQPAQPGATVPKIDPGLAASKLAIIGTLNGLRGTIYVTNTAGKEITPVVQLIVCDDKGAKIGVASKTGGALAPDADEKIVLLATNMYATDLKLMRVTSVGAK